MSSVRSAAKVYADQLFSLGHGYPLWDPEPKYYEVAIGDVGWIDNFGAFYPLFNAVEDPEHERNREGVPDGHKRFPTPQWRPATGHIPAGVYHSKTVTRLQASAHVGGHGASGGFHYQCTDKQGAALVIKEAAYRTALHHSRRMSNYMKENLHKWLEFAEQKDVNLSQEDIYFVRGFVKARSWYVTAWMYEGQSGRLSISGDLGSAAQAKVDIDYGRDTERSPELNWGPQGNINQDHPDQCVFLHYYKMKVRLGFWPVMRAAAEPRDPTPGRDSPEPGGSQAGTHGSGSYHFEQVPAREKANDPADFVLDYILSNSVANMAIATDEDLVKLCRQYGREIPTPIDIPHFLEEIRPHIEVNEDSLGMLLHEDDHTEEHAGAAQGSAETATSEGSHTNDDNIESQAKGKRTDNGVIILEDQGGGICALVYSPDGRYVAGGTEESEVIIWEAQSGNEVHRFTEHEESICSLAFSPDGREIVSGSRDETAIIWNIEAGSKRATLTGHTGFVYSVAWAPDGRTIATASVDFTVRIWDAATGTQLSSRDDHNTIVVLVAYSPDSQLLASAGADYSARVWKVADGELVSILDGHTGIIYSLAFSPDSRRIITGSDDGTARIWMAESGEELVTLREHAGSVWSAVFAPDTQRVLSAASDGTVSVCHSFSGEKLLSLEGGDALVNAAAFSPDGERICTSAGDNALRVWSSRSDQPLATLEGHTDKVGYIKFSPDGNSIVSSSDDNSIRIWDLRRFIAAGAVPSAA